MPICYGSVVSKKLPKNQESNHNLLLNEEKIDVICVICFEKIESKPLICLNPYCSSTSHIICLSKIFCNQGDYIPVEGKCPQCDDIFLWGDIVRKYKGCYSNLNLVINTEIGNDFYNTDSE